MFYLIALKNTLAYVKVGKHPVEVQVEEKSSTFRRANFNILNPVRACRSGLDHRAEFHIRVCDPWTVLQAVS